MKTRPSPTWIPGLVLAFTLAWTPGSPAQTDRKPPPATGQSAPDVSATGPAAPLSPATAAAAQPPAARTLTPRSSSPALFPLNLYPAAGPLSFDAIDRDGLPANNRFSYWTTEVIKLARAGIDDDVLLSFIDSVGMFNLSADEIIYLNDLGVSSRVMATMIQHDFEVAAGLRFVTASASPSPMLFAFGPVTEPAADSGKQPSSTPAPPVRSEPPVPGNPSPTAAEPTAANHDDVVSDLVGLGFAMTEPPPPAPSRASGHSPPATARTHTLYAVRQPYAEELTPPIIFVPAFDPVPNVVLIRMNP